MCNNSPEVADSTEVPGLVRLSRTGLQVGLPPPGHRSLNKVYVIQICGWHWLRQFSALTEPTPPFPLSSLTLSFIIYNPLLYHLSPLLYHLYPSPSSSLSLLHHLSPSPISSLLLSFTIYSPLYLPLLISFIIFPLLLYHLSPSPLSSPYFSLFFLKKHILFPILIEINPF